MNAERLNAYRKTLERRMWYFRIMWLVYLLLLAARRFFGPNLEGGLLYGMLTGMMTGGLLVAAVFMAKFRRAMKDEKQLLRLYNAEHDERRAAILGRIGYPIVVIFSLALLAAALVASFFDETVTMTLTAVAVAQLLACCVLKAWYSRRM